MQRLIIGIQGRSRAGKSTAAFAFVERARNAHELNVESYELSKYILRTAYEEGRIPRGKNREKLTTEEIAILVEIGERERNRDPDHWLNQAEAEMVEDKVQVAIVPNIRVMHEAQWIRKHKGVLVDMKSHLKSGAEYIGSQVDPNSDLETAHYVIPADFYLSVPRGQPALLKELSYTLFDYLWALNNE